MNTKHFPDLSLCKKLTEIGFTETEKVYSRSVGGYVTGPRAGEKFDFQIKRRVLPGEMTTCDCKEEYLCPSVMEMLDVIETPLHHRLSIDKMFDIDDGVWYKVSFYSSEHFNDLIKGFQGNLPDALAEMCLWLHKYNVISFSK